MSPQGFLGATGGMTLVKVLAHGPNKQTDITDIGPGCHTLWGLFVDVGGFLSANTSNS